jgi:hypothetical protein
MIQPIPYHECCRIREALKESDRIDALIDEINAPDAHTLPLKEIERLGVQQQAAWALVRLLVLDAAETTDYDPPVCVDIGDAAIIVYSNQDNGDGVRSMDAGWIASWRIVRPGETPEWAKEDETGNNKEAA